MAGNEGADGKRRYTACLPCTQTCYRTHGMANYNGSCFFKVMLQDFTKSLRIPPKFVEQINDRMGPDVILEGPSGQLWHAELCCMGTTMTIENGWKSFVSDHSIEFGDFLVFKHAGKSHFIVQIFGRSGCEKQSAFSVTSIESPMHGQEKKKNIQSPTFIANNLSFGSKETTREDGIDTRYSAVPCTAIPDHKVHSSVTRKRYQRIDQIAPVCYPNSSMPLPVSTANPTECTNMLKTGGSVKDVETLKHTLSSYKKEVKLEKNETKICDYQLTIGRHGSQMGLRVKELMDTIRRPYFLVDMKKTHLCPSFRLNIPLDFMRKWLPKSKAEVILLGPDKVQWSAISPGENTIPHSLRGWRDFAVNYNLKMQDICIFELLNKHVLMLEVHIQKNFRMSSRKKGSAKRMEYQTPKIEDFKFSSKKIQDKIKEERDFSLDLPLFSCVPSYQTKLPKRDMCSEKPLKHGCEGGKTILNGEKDSVAAVMMDQKPYFLRGDFRRTFTGPDTAGNCKNGTPTRNLACSNVIVLE